MPNTYFIDTETKLYKDYHVNLKYINDILKISEDKEEELKEEIYQKESFGIQSRPYGAFCQSCGSYEEGNGMDPGGNREKREVQCHLFRTDVSGGCYQLWPGILRNFRYGEGITSICPFDGKV